MPDDTLTAEMVERRCREVREDARFDWAALFEKFGFRPTLDMCVISKELLAELGIPEWTLPENVFASAYAENMFLIRRDQLAAGGESTFGWAGNSP